MAKKRTNKISKPQPKLNPTKFGLAGGSCIISSNIDLSRKRLCNTILNINHGCLPRILNIIRWSNSRIYLWILRWFYRNVVTYMVI